MKKLRILSAPTLYCVFSIGIILVMVGTFITAHAYVSDHSDDHHASIDPVLLILGPILLGCGGLFLVGMSLLCFVVYRKNRGRIPLDKEDLFSVGGSTFYNHQPHLLNNIDDLSAGNCHHQTSGIDNMSGPNRTNDSIWFMKDAVLHGRQEVLAKISASSPGTLHPDEHPLSRDLVRISRMDPEATICHYHASGLERGKLENYGNHGVTNQQQFGSLNGRHCKDCLAEEYSLQPLSRHRYYSMSEPRPQFRLEKGQEGQDLRRIATVTPTARQKFKENQRRRHENPSGPVAASVCGPTGSPFLSLRRKKLSKKERKTSQANVHPLPSYSPDILSDLLQLGGKPNFPSSQRLNQSQQILSSESPNSLTVLQYPAVGQDSSYDVATDKHFPSPAIPIQPSGGSNGFVLRTPTALRRKQRARRNVSYRRNSSPIPSSTDEECSVGSAHEEAAAPGFMSSRGERNSKRRPARSPILKPNSGSDSNSKIEGRSFVLTTSDSNGVTSSTETDSEARSERKKRRLKRRSRKRSKPQQQLQCDSKMLGDERRLSQNMSGGEHLEEECEQEEEREESSISKDPHQQLPAPPTPSDASALANEIMFSLCRTELANQRPKKALSVITSNDECWASEEETRDVVMNVENTSLK